MIPETTQSQNTIKLPNIPALCLNAKSAHLLTTEGELKTLPHAQITTLLHKQPVLVCHAPYIRGRLGQDADFFPFDLLELFAFIHPGQFATPTINGLCKSLGLAEPQSREDAPMAMIDITRALLSDLQSDPHSAKADPIKIAEIMGLNGNGWAWTPFICAALGKEYDPKAPIHAKDGFNVWKNLPEWSDDAPAPPPSHHPVTHDEARERLQKLLGHNAENRQAQIEFAANITNAFTPKQDVDAPHIVLAEAGTGVGKTLGYLAPASVWAEKNEGSVWVSTYTKNLQRQIDQELDRLYPSQQIKDAHIATRKGRENYLCLLNLQETANGATLAKHTQTATAIGIMARWTAATKDGDLTGGQYPGWLTSILGYANSTGLSDRRGECVYSACDHYSKCFVEHSVRKAKNARIVIANHAIVMINAAMNGADDEMPNRYIFDEGHHLFDAADSAYAAHLTARETRDLRRWLLGNEGGRRSSRARGLKKRAEDLAEGMQDAEEALSKVLSAAECLPKDQWTRRLRDAQPSGPTEHFLHEIYNQVFARSNGRNGPYSLETEVFPVSQNVAETASKLKYALIQIQKPMNDLANIFHKKLTDDHDGLLDSDTRKRLEAVGKSLERRASLTLGAWIDMLENLNKGQKHNEFVDWLEIERIDGKAIDVGYYRHHTDPMKPFAASMAPHLHGMTITSATLRDSDDWQSARIRSGAHYLSPASHDVSFESPFDYSKQTKIFIINDVRKDDLQQVASAYQALFTASNGSALGLFTAISRLRSVHHAIAANLEEKAIPLYAQHVDEIDTGTLVDMFREDTQSCLLGTDAIRDGVDVPGESLKLIAFDRVPWPRPTILHKARRNAFIEMLGSARAYDEMITRLKLKQAFGRLIRRADDKGVFVMMDPMLPTRLQDAFPKDVEIIKTGLSDVVQEIKNFL
ncbi:MAG: ATP-dependent DNA helicase [Bdellovibrionales bacterium]